MGVFDLTAPLLSWIDTTVLGFLPAWLRILLWSAVAAALVMAVYALVSPQERLARLAREARKARAALTAYDGEFEGLAQLAIRSLRLSLAHLGMAYGPALLAGLPFLFILVWMSTASAQSPQGEQAEAPRPAVDTTGIQLVYEREVFSYGDRGRRDPFRPLTSSDDTGPRFEELVLQGVKYSTGQWRSVALIADASGRIYRVRAGDVVGNSRVVEIGPLRVVLAVENFGTIRREMLELRKRGGADR